MKRMLTICLLLACIVALALPAHAELVFGPWQPNGEGQWVREVQDGEHKGKQHGNGEDAEHVKGLYFNIDITDASGNRLQSDFYFPDGTPYYSTLPDEDGWQKSKYYDPDGSISSFHWRKQEGETTTDKYTRADGSLSSLIVYQGNDNTLAFKRVDAKSYDEQGQLIRYWEMVHDHIDEQGNWLRIRRDYTADGRLTSEVEILFINSSQRYAVSEKQYREDGRLEYLLIRDFYKDIISKRWLAEEADGSFKITFLQEGPKPPEGERPVLADAWYRYQKDGTFLEGQELDLETREMKAVTEAPKEDPLRDNWLGIVPVAE